MKPVSFTRRLLATSFATLLSVGVAACGDEASPAPDTGRTNQVGKADGPPATTPKAAIGGACGETSQCGTGPAPVCIEPDFEWLNGYCSSACTANAECGDGGGCVSFDDGSSRCLELCSFDTDCRAGYACFDLDGPGYCIPQEMAERAEYATVCDELGYEGTCVDNTVYWCDDTGTILDASCADGCVHDANYGWMCR